MHAANRRRVERLAWGGGFVALLAAGFAVFLVLDHRVHSGQRERAGVDAHCAVVAGQRLTSHAIRISCGLGEADVRAAVTQAVGRVDLTELVDKARKGQLQDQAEVRDLAERVGISGDKLMQALQQLGQERTGDAALADRLAALVLIDTPVVDVTISRDGAGSAGTEAEHSADQPAPAPRANNREQDMVAEAKNLSVNCSAEGRNVSVDVVDIHCGPSEAEISSLITQVISQADSPGLVKLAMQGGDPNAPQIATLGKQLGLTNVSVAQILATLGKEGVPNDQFAQRFTELAHKHMDLVLRAWGLPDGNPAIQSLREQAMAALAQDHYGRAEALLAAAELTRRSAASSSPSALTVAAQNDDRGRELLQKRDYTGATRLFASAAAQVPDELPLVRAAYLIDQANAVRASNDNDADKDAGSLAVPLYRRAFEFIVLSFADLCPDWHSPGDRDSYKAPSKDKKVSWSMDCPERR
jgi:hypothetical protein